MSRGYLLDTDWIIHYLSGRTTIVERIDELRDGQRLGLSILSVAELYGGAFSSRDPEATEQKFSQFLEGMLVVGIDQLTCRVYGREYATLRKRGEMIGAFDLMIAATALRHDFTLLSNNRRDFERIRGLAIESL